MIRPRWSRRSRWGAAARSVTLTLGAVLGVICLVWTVGLAAVGVRPLVFASGSMAPAFEVGDVAFVRPVPADEVTVGDVVSVTTDSGVRVTHRVVEAETVDATTTLRLQGDANDSRDAQGYDVTTADLVVGRLPLVGPVLTRAGSPWAIGAGLLLLFACVWLAFRGRVEGEVKEDLDQHRIGRAQTGEEDVPRVAQGAEPDGAGGTPRARQPLQPLSVLVALVVLAASGAALAPIDRTLAYFTDTPKISTPVDGVDAAPWFTCAQSMSTATYGSQPWAHLNLDDNSLLPQLSATSPYFTSSTDTAWDGIYFLGNVWNGSIPNSGQGQACWRDGASRSVRLEGSTTLTTQYIRLQTQSQDQNGPAGARWNTFSVNVWFKTLIQAGDDNAGVLAAYSQSGGIEAGATDRVLYLDSTGRVVFEVYPGAHKFRSTSGTYADNTWHMATMTLGPGGQCLYLDSRIAGACDTTVTTAYQSNNPTFWRFGYAYLSAGFQGITDGNVEQRAFKGYLDDVAVWTRQLSQQEIQDMYRAGLPLRG